MKKNIAVYFTGSSFYDYPFNDPQYLRAYRDLGARIHAQGSAMSIVRDFGTYCGGNCFAGGWLYEDALFSYTPSLLRADLIFHKGTRLFDDEQAIILNRREMDEICLDKYKTFSAFPHLSPKTAIVQSPQELRDTLNAFSDDMVVLKPVDDYGGNGVFIGSKEEAAAKVGRYPYLVQSFIDTSRGIPGITNTSHDFRVIIFSGAVAVALLRTPMKGSFVANLSQGGSIRAIAGNAIPNDVLDIVREVDGVFQQYGKRIYSIDCALDRHGAWKLIELNSQPGLVLASEVGDEIADAYLADLAAFLVA